MERSGTLCPSNGHMGPTKHRTIGLIHVNYPLISYIIPLNHPISAETGFFLVLLSQSLSNEQAFPFDHLKDASILEEKSLQSVLKASVI